MCYHQVYMHYLGGICCENYSTIFSNVPAVTLVVYQTIVPTGLPALAVQEIVRDSPAMSVPVSESEMLGSMGGTE